MKDLHCRKLTFCNFAMPLNFFYNLTFFQSYVWKELLLAAIGEQFIDFLPEDDDICGLSVSPREKDDLIQIWNINSKAVQQSRVLEKVHSLVPDVRFNAEFYKRKSKYSKPSVFNNFYSFSKLSKFWHF